MIDRGKSKKQTSQNEPVNFDFSQHVQVPDGVMFHDIDGESVLLNLNTGLYFGLDDVGTRMWVLLTEAPSIQNAFDTLEAEYDVERTQLRVDLSALLAELTEKNLLVLKDA